MKFISNWTGRIILALGIGVIFFIGALFLRGGEQWYQAQSQVIVLAKDDKTARNLDVVLKNIALIPRTLSFYQSFTEGGGNLGGLSDSNLSSTDKKVLWRQLVDTKIIDGTSIIAIRDRGAGFDEVKDANSQIVKQLVITASRYYDSNNEAEIKVIGDVELTYLRDYRPLLFGILGAILGFLAAWFLGVFFKDRKLDQVARTAVHNKFLEDVFGKKEKKETEKKSDEDEKGKPAYTEADAEKIPAVSEVEKNEPAADIPAVSTLRTTEKKGAAPANLPTGIVSGAEAELENSEEKEKDKKDDNDKIDGTGSVSVEPTDEEVKERLNALIRGEL